MRFMTTVILPLSLMVFKKTRFVLFHNSTKIEATKYMKFLDELDDAYVKAFVTVLCLCILKSGYEQLKSILVLCLSRLNLFSLL